MAVEGGPCFGPSWKNQKAYCDSSFSVEHHGSMSHHVSPEVNAKGFTKYCMSSAVDVTDDDALWNYGKGRENVSSKCEEDESTDCEDGESDTDC
jgi:hypothetical protein